MSAAPEVTQSIEQIDWQIDFIESLQRLNDQLQYIRGHVRPTDHIQEALDEPGLGDTLRSFWSLLKELDTTFKQIPSSMNTLDDRIDQVRQITSGADAITRMIRMFEEADTATAGQQVTDMSYLFKDVQALLPALKYLIEGFKLNPVIGAYLTVLGMALEQIAISIGQIEEAARIRNELIQSERDRALGREPAPDAPAPDVNAGLQEAVDELKRQREQLLEEMNRAAMTDLRAARDRCYREHGVSQAEMDSREDALAEGRRRLRDAWERRQNLEGERLNLPSELGEAEIRLETVKTRRSRGAASEAELETAQREVDDLKQRAEQIDEAIREADDALRAAYEEFNRLRALVQPILDCIRRTLNRYGRDPEWFRRYQPWYMDPNYWAPPELRRIESHLGVPSTLASADVPSRFLLFGNPIALVAVVVLAAVLTIGGASLFFLGGGDGDEVVDVPAGLVSTAEANVPIATAGTDLASATSPIAAPAPVLTVSPIVATFFQDIATTEYLVEASSSDGSELTYEWSGADCGEAATDSGNPALFRWTHPHPPCDATTDHADRTIVVVVTDGVNTVRCEYQGAHTGTGEECAPQ